MFESGYYPAGAEHDHRAPWNQEEQPSRDFFVQVSVTLEKGETITTNDYFSEVEDDGSACVSTTDTDWDAAYKESCFTITDLLNAFQTLLKKEISRSNDKREIIRLHNLLAAAQGWKVVDTNFEY